MGKQEAPCWAEGFVVKGVGAGHFTTAMRLASLMEPLATSLMM